MIEGTDTATAPLRPRWAPAGRVPRPAWVSAITPDTWALIAVAAAVVVANLPYLLDLFDANPLDVRGGLTSAITPGLLRGRPTIDPSNGFTSQAIGHLAALDLLHLHLPWWNPYEGTGMPLVGETQAAALFPLTLLTALSNGQLYEHIVLEIIGGICTYRLLARIGVVRPAAVAGAVAFALNGKFAWFADATVNPLPFLPMLLLGIERGYAAVREGRPGGWRLIALAGALSVYAGFPEVAYVDTLPAIFWLGWRCCCLTRAQLRPLATKLALAIAAGTLLAAPMLVAMATYLNQADLGIHTGTQLGSAHLSAAALPQLLMPYIYGEVNAAPRATTWIMVGGYLTATLLVCALVGLVSARRRGIAVMLAAWAALVFARMYDEPPLLGHILGIVPEIARMQFFRYATATLALPVIILAALGLDALIRGPARRRQALGAAVVAGALTGVAAWGARPVVHRLGTGLHQGAFFHASVIWAVLGVGAVVAATLAPARRVRAPLLAAVVVADAFVLFVVPDLAAPRAATVDLAPVSYLREHLGDGRFFTLGPIAPDYGSYFGLASLGVDDFPPKLYARYIHGAVDPAAPFTGFRPLNQPSPTWELFHHLPGYRFAGVRYVLAPAGQSLPQAPGALSLVFSSPTTRIYRLGGAAAYFSAPGCRVSSTGRDSARVACSQPTTLVRRETDLPGWAAALDGHSAPVRRVGDLFQGVAVPAGTHRVTFTFAPPGIGWALLGMVAGGALLLAPAARRRRGVSSRHRAAA